MWIEGKFLPMGHRPMDPMDNIHPSFRWYLVNRPGKEGEGPLSNLYSGGDTKAHSISHPNNMTKE